MVDRIRADCDLSRRARSRAATFGARRSYDAIPHRNEILEPCFPEKTWVDPSESRHEELGTQLDTEELPDLTRVSLEVSAEHWREALALLVGLVKRSVSDASVVSAYRTPLGYSYATTYVFEAGPVPSLPGEFRPKIELGRVVAGYPLAPADPGNRVSAAAVSAIAARSLAANLVVFGIGGRVTPDAVSKTLDELTTGWEVAPEPMQNAPAVDEGASTPSVSTIDVPSLEGWIAIGRAIGPVPDAARAPLAVAADILSTRLNISVREVRGLANRTVCLVPTAASGAGLLHIRSGGRPDAVGPIVKFSLDELRRIHSAEDVIGADELETAKGALALGLWQTSLDGARSTSSTRAGPRPVRAAIWTASAGSQRRRFRSTKVVQHFQRLN